MAYNKVVYDGQTLIDLTDLDVTASDVMSGVTFILADGTKAVGTLQNELFWVTYGVTTSAEIESAYQAGKDICCIYNGRTYRLCKRASSAEHLFSSSYLNSGYRITCTSDSWDSGTLDSIVDATSTPTSNKVSKFDASAHMNSEDMSSADVTSFVNGLNYSRVLVSVETKELLWTNSNPTSAFDAQSITCGGGFDSYEIVYTGYVGQPNVKQTVRLSEDEVAMTYITGSTGYVGGALYVFKRTCDKTDDGVTFGAVYYSADGTSWTTYPNKTGCVPYKIYGCKLTNL